MKKELIRPTKIYVKEIFKVLIDNNLINGCANITGGGLVDNISRIIPTNFVLKLIWIKLIPSNFSMVKKKIILKIMKCLKHLIVV